ncbi:hypothetical protein [Polaribacter butkevichii]|uniref:Uncharacterized protein n=1 Tax=Polaribacter butkevichii TaxID=218490 RepID=A0A2P6CFB1_9FLAO|nr:hypothetical protein [Polaribacter butkevichii]PQJ73599.1 hypothetical protein BTO14_10115 [Polaribacter butkevichii]
MESEENQAKNINTIELKIDIRHFGLDEISKLEIELDNLKSIGLNFDKEKYSKYLTIKLPVSLIFYVEYRQKKINFHLCCHQLILTDLSYTSLVKMEEKINAKICNKNPLNKFVHINSYYLVRKRDVKGYDYADRKVLLSSISHNYKCAKIEVGRDYKIKLFENIDIISRGLLLIKSIHNIEYIIYPQDIRSIESHTKSKVVFLENNLHTNIIEIKLSNSSEKLTDFFKDEFNIIFNYGSFIKFNRSVIYNLRFFEENLLEDNIYNDPICGKIEIQKKVLKKLNL